MNVYLIGYFEKKITDVRRIILKVSWKTEKLLMNYCSTSIQLHVKNRRRELKILTSEPLEITLTQFKWKGKMCLKECVPRTPYSQVNNGLPQGSVLDPLLFSLYIVDMPATSLRKFSYVDDWFLAIDHKNIQTTENILGNDLTISMITSKNGKSISVLQGR